MIKFNGRVGLMIMLAIIYIVEVCGRSGKEVECGRI